MHKSETDWMHARGQPAMITQKFVVTMFVSSMVELNGKGKILEFILDSTSKL